VFHISTWGLGDLCGGTKLATGLMITEVRWLSKVDFLTWFATLYDTIVKFLNDNDPGFALSLLTMWCS